MTIYEIVLGIELLPRGKKREALEAVLFHAMIWPFKHRVLPFTFEAAQATASLTVKRRRMGRPISLADAQIAGIVEAHSATLVTRDVDDFAGLDFDVVNPWDAD